MRPILLIFRELFTARAALPSKPAFCRRFMQKKQKTVLNALPLCDILNCNGICRKTGGML